VANTDFKGGDNDNGYGDYLFLVKHGQPGHMAGLGLFNQASVIA
jgi:hypothetical protein